MDEGEEAVEGSDVSESKDARPLSCPRHLLTCAPFHLREGVIKDLEAAGLGFPQLLCDVDDDMYEMTAEESDVVDTELGELAHFVSD